MRPPDVEAAAARHVPGKGPATIAHLRSGLVHETFRVERDGRAYSLRVPAGHPLDIALDFAWEAEVIALAAAAALAPRPRYCDPGRGVLVLDWVAGRAWSVEEARTPECLARMASVLRRLHAVPVPLPGRQVAPARWIELYREAGADAGQDLARAAKQRLARLEAGSPGGHVLCHSDLHVLNVVDRGAGLTLLDFEYAHVSDPLWDVAAWSANNDFSGGLRDAWAAAYLGRAPTADESARLGLLAWLYDYVCLLWGLTYAARAGGSASPDPGIAARAEAVRRRLEAGVG